MEYGIWAKDWLCVREDIERKATAVKRVLLVPNYLAANNRNVFKANVFLTLCVPCLLHSIPQKRTSA
jgi:hypothetical protein